MGEFRPSGQQGRDLAATIRQRLGASFRHLLEATRPHLALPEAAIASQLAAIDAADRVRPEIFVVHHDLVRAAVRSDLGALAAGFAALAETPVAAPAGLTIRNWGDASFSAAELGRFRWAFGEEGDTPLTFAAAEPDVLATATRSLRAALATLAVAEPELLAEISALVTDVVLARSEIAGGMTFDGVSTFHAQGALVLNALENRSIPGALATLVHEAAHSLLFAATEGHALAENDPEECFPSPLRRDPRPMNGVVHATFVSARMAYALNRALAADALPPADRPEAAQLLAGARAAFAAGQAVVRSHGRLTDAGAAFLTTAARYMASPDEPVTV